MITAKKSHKKKKGLPLSESEAFERLNLFIEKAENLKASSLIKTISIKQGSSIGQLEVPKRYPVRPEWDQIDAFLLTLRLFICDTDVISIRNIAGILDELKVSQAPKDIFNKQRNILNNYLDRKCPWVIQGDRVTNREVLETILYGFHGHVNLEKYRRYKKWVSGPFGIPMVYTVFIDIVQDFLRMLLVLSFNCRLMVEELSAKPENTKQGR